MRVEAGVSAGHVAVAQGGQVDGVVLEDLFFGNSLRKTGERLLSWLGYWLVGQPTKKGVKNLDHLMW